MISVLLAQTSHLPLNDCVQSSIIGYDALQKSFFYLKYRASIAKRLS